MKLAIVLLDDLQKHSENRTMRFRHDKLNVQCIFPKISKTILDEVDTVLATHYRFTPGELDFIPHYDIKYHIGGAAENEAED